MKLRKVKPPKIRKREPVYFLSTRYLKFVYDEERKLKRRVPRMFKTIWSLLMKYGVFISGNNGGA